MRARRRHPAGSSWREHLHSRVPMKQDPGLNQRGSCSPNAYRVPLDPSLTPAPKWPLCMTQLQHRQQQHPPSNGALLQITINTKKQENNPQQLNLHSPKHCLSWGCSGGAHSSWAAPTGHPNTAQVPPTQTGLGGSSLPCLQAGVHKHLGGLGKTQLVLPPPCFLSPPLRVGGVAGEETGPNLMMVANIPSTCRGGRRTVW